MSDTKGTPSKKLDYKEGEMIFSEGEESSRAFIVDQGSVKVYRTNSMGIKETLQTFKKGQIFGEMGMIDNEPRSASAVAIEDSTITVIEKGQFDSLSSEHSAFFRNLIKALTHRLRGTLNLLLAARDAHARRVADCSPAGYTEIAWPSIAVEVTPTGPKGCSRISRVSRTRWLLGEGDHSSAHAPQAKNGSLP